MNADEARIFNKRHRARTADGKGDQGIQRKLGYDNGRNPAARCTEKLIGYVLFSVFPLRKTRTGTRY